MRRPKTSHNWTHCGGRNDPDLVVLRIRSRQIVSWMPIDGVHCGLEGVRLSRCPVPKHLSNHFTGFCTGTPVGSPGDLSPGAQENPSANESPQSSDDRLFVNDQWTLNTTRISLLIQAHRMPSVESVKVPLYRLLKRRRAPLPGDSSPETSEPDSS